MENKDKNDFSQAFQNFGFQNEEKEVLKPVIQEAKIRKKIGRPSHKVAGVKYVKVCAQLPEATRDAMHNAKLNRFKGKYVSLDELINDALLAFLT